MESQSWRCGAVEARHEQSVFDPEATPTLAPAFDLGSFAFGALDGAMSAIDGGVSSDGGGGDGGGGGGSSRDQD